MGELVFVYGTLMRGEGNYRRFFQGNPKSNSWMRAWRKDLVFIM